MFRSTRSWLNSHVVCEVGFAEAGETGKVSKRRKIVERRMRSEFVVVGDPRVQESLRVFEV